MKTAKKLAMAAAALALLAGTAMAQSVEVDSKLPPYIRTTGVCGNMASVTSDTKNNLMTLWAEGYQRMDPDVQVEIAGSLPAWDCPSRTRCP